MNKLLELLKEKHGGELKFDNYQSYYLFLKDGLLTVYMDQDTKTLKIEVEMLQENEVYIYHSDEKMENLM
ncbi:hypothetical protein AB1K09_20360 [Solibacillus silvestris]